MPRRDDIESILIIGAGPIVIGQACEFDYSGTQACKALKEEGYRVILVNSNPATIMTDPASADAIYIEPIQWRTVARIIEKERPSALLPTMGGSREEESLPDSVRATHRSLFDGSLQGIERLDRPAFSFQGHPEASPGPHDLLPLFERFIAQMKAYRSRSI